MAFIKSHQILDNFVIAEEVIHRWRKDKEGGVLVKLDFEKAYDMVDHGFWMICWKGWALVISGGNRLRVVFRLRCYR